MLVLAQVGIVFLLPSGGVWWFEDIAAHTPGYNAVMFVIESLFIMFMFSFSSILSKNLRKTLILSLLGLLNFGLVFFMQVKGLLPQNTVAYIHPVTLALFINFAVYKRWYYALLGYVFGLFFSLAPLMTSLVPILFFQLWTNAIIAGNKQEKAAAFFARCYMYYIIMLHFFATNITIVRGLEFCPRMMLGRHITYLAIILSLTICYLLLGKYLNQYYQNRRNALFYLSFIPVLWIIPLFSILITKNTPANN